MSNKHTPGPWVLTEGRRFNKEMVITTQRRLDESIGCICEMDVYYTGQVGIEQEANARLIAAAPELLEALQKLVAHDDYLIEMGLLKHCMELDRARAAIAKALGDPHGAT